MIYKFTDSKQQQLFFVSDYHFGHRGILEHVPERKRLFGDVENMDNELLKRTNNLVKPNDILFFLGDFCFNKHIHSSVYLNRINCNNIHWCNGNHDAIEEIATNNKIKSMHDIMEIQINKSINIVLCHYRMASYNKAFHGAFHLYGHEHQNHQSAEDEISYNVGVEWTNYEPLSFAKLMEIMKPKKEKWLLKHKKEQNVI